MALADGKKPYTDKVARIRNESRSGRLKILL